MNRLVPNGLVPSQLLAAAAVALALGACNNQYATNAKSLMPIPPATTAQMSARGMKASDPMLVRVYKKEAELEIWKKVDGHYAHLKTFPICRWSGQLGPKVREGDRQAPEGFYSITPGQMNPNSSYYLSFDTGFPNAYDRAHSRTGKYLMVHGTCSSAGCYAMTDEGIAEVYALARESFNGGQKSFQFQAYPFRMTAQNLARYRQDPNMPFWQNLKEGADNFEVTKQEPKVAVCRGRYAFNTVGADGCQPDPTLAPVVAEKEAKDRQKVAELVQEGAPSVRLLYADGGQHDSFRSTASGSPAESGSDFAVLDSRPSRRLGEVSRPEALAEGPREVAMETAKPAGRGPTRVAAAEKARAEAESGTTKAGTPKPGTIKPGLLADAAAKPDGRPGRPAVRTLLASADPDEPIAAPAAAKADDRPLYRKLLGSVMGSSDVAEPSAPANRAEPIPGTAPDAPVPVKKRAAAAAPARPVDAKNGSGGKAETRKGAKQEGAKPEAAAPVARKHAAAVD